MNEAHPSHWRLIQSPPSSGGWNMALDEAILEAVGRGESLPTLRLYAWDPPCISLGVAQSVHDVDLKRLRTKRWNLVRRSTGGRAILHTDELTYAVIAPINNPHVIGGVLDSYRHLSAGLVAGLQHMGMSVGIEPEKQLTEEERGNPVCFQAPSAYEITVKQRKLLGSAQVRRRFGILQHGTLPLKGDITRICEVLQFNSEEDRISAIDALRNRAATVEDLLGEPLSWERAAEAMSEGFRQALDLQLESGDPSSAEVTRAEDLLRERFANSQWTERI
ncbi:MAG: lipoate--protein ligase family protein [Anaerolineales bacterium]|nr:MAG: lipoate--protein ligase family protein [Anaerolineales bacterium]